MNTAVLISVNHSLSRKVCESIEGNTYESNDLLREDVYKKLGEDFSFSISRLTDFMDLCNNQELDLEDYFLSFVTVN